MDTKFFDSLYQGDSPNGVKLGMPLTGGDFWPRQAGCHTVYRGQDGDIDYDTIQAVMESGDSQVSVANQGLPANTIWYFIRRQVSGCGLESPDSDECVVQIDADGAMLRKMPNQPTNLTIEQVAGAKLKLQWIYSSLGQQIAPTGFKIYIDSGSGFDYESPADTVSYSSGRDSFAWTSDALTDGQLYKFVVRSYTTGEGQTQNTNYVAAFADSTGPPAITDINASWEVI
ncbi:MAG TPA: hypothetical protein HPP51_05515 [Planctomycetes bacterium]|nr:hypothetical protein [Planctomycetota bacterium]